MADQIAPAKARYKFKGGATQMIHPAYGGSTPILLDHLNGPDGATFIKAIKHLDKQNSLGPDGKPKPDFVGWFDRFIEEVK